MPLQQRHAARAAEAGRHWEPRGGWQAGKQWPSPCQPASRPRASLPVPVSHIQQPAACMLRNPSTAALRTPPSHANTALAAVQRPCRRGSHPQPHDTALFKCLARHAEPPSALGLVGSGALLLHADSSTHPPLYTRLCTFRHLHSPRLYHSPPCPSVGKHEPRCSTSLSWPDESACCARHSGRAAVHVTAPGFAQFN